MIRELKDIGETKASVEWVDDDGNRGTSEGDPEASHMTALINHARHQNVRVEREKWVMASYMPGRIRKG